MDGMYAMYFTGFVGSGNGLVILKNGIIAGADSAGGLYDGSYVAQDDGTATGTVRLTLPAGGQLVTGASAGSEPMVFEIPLKLPINLGNGTPISMNTPTGPINIIFKRLRDVP